MSEREIELTRQIRKLRRVRAQLRKEVRGLQKVVQELVACLKTEFKKAKPS